MVVVARGNAPRASAACGSRPAPRSPCRRSPARRWPGPPAATRATARRCRDAGAGTRRRVARGRSRTLPQLHERMLGEVLTRNRHVALLGLDEDAAVADLEDAAFERADLHVVAGRLALARVVPTDPVREVLTRPERDHAGATPQPDR